jgi:hypothetical protein
MTSITGLLLTGRSSVLGNAYNFTSSAFTLYMCISHCLARMTSLLSECSGRQDIEPISFRLSTDVD